MQRLKKGIIQEDQSLARWHKIGTTGGNQSEIISGTCSCHCAARALQIMAVCLSGAVWMALKKKDKNIVHEEQFEQGQIQR